MAVYRAGFKWDRWEDEGDGETGWSAQVSDRYTVSVARHGNRFTCSIHATYPLSRDSMDGPNVNIWLQDRPTRDKAMRHAALWANRLVKEGPQGPEELFTDLFHQWPTLNRTRLDVIGHLFFTNGNGYEWLDGCIVEGAPEAYLRYDTRKDMAKNAQSMAGFRKFVEANPDDQSPLAQTLRAQVERYVADGFGPHPDNGKPRDFYPICKYAKILLVPDDVRDDWLAVAYEAAVLLRDRSGLDEDPSMRIEAKERQRDEQRAYGVKVIEELRTRFPGRVPMEG